MFRILLLPRSEWFSCDSDFVSDSVSDSVSDFVSDCISDSLTDFVSDYICGSNFDSFSVSVSESIVQERLPDRGR